MTSQERHAVHSQLEHLQAKYVGTGHADTTKLCARPAPHGAPSPDRRAPRPQRLGRQPAPRLVCALRGV